MPQNEDKKRLLLNGKIVGHEHRIANSCKYSMGIFHHKYPPFPKSSGDISIYPDERIAHDSFELGIKVGDEWRFMGDTFLSIESRVLYELFWSDELYAVMFCPVGDYEMSTLYNPKKTDRFIGNIHEEIK